MQKVREHQDTRVDPASFKVIHIPALCGHFMQNSGTNPANGEVPPLAASPNLLFLAARQTAPHFSSLHTYTKEENIVNIIFFERT